LFLFGLDLQYGVSWIWDWEVYIGFYGVFGSFVVGWKVEYGLAWQSEGYNDFMVSRIFRGRYPLWCSESTGGMAYGLGFTHMASVFCVYWLGLFGGRCVMRKVLDNVVEMVPGYHCQ
jgi:hypothetical protein